MTRLTEPSARRFFADHPEVVLITITGTRGSAPRDEGTHMLVSKTAICGTIGGGTLEHLAIARARDHLEGESIKPELELSLGPDLGQCCGGRVHLSMRVAGPALRKGLTAELAAQRRAYPPIYVFGAGHVGAALCRALAPLPFRTHVVETREAQLSAISSEVTTHLTAIPESLVEEAPDASAFIILTHDHALDFLITGAALKRADARYVGMIGSKSKRNRFRSWFLEHGGTMKNFDRLVCPIGGNEVGDKRPEVIAALTAAELVRTFSSEVLIGQPHEAK